MTNNYLLSVLGALTLHLYIRTPEHGCEGSSDAPTILAIKTMYSEILNPRICIESSPYTERSGDSCVSV